MINGGNYEFHEAHRLLDFSLLYLSTVLVLVLLFSLCAASNQSPNSLPRRNQVRAPEAHLSHAIDIADAPPA
ncbi:hypothetical protein SAY87_031960 [Trapa incisa]|uniref:Uncharacterized protein n=1 Tax=Trapa incisa TaxID=236973 RepID=A0AAN7KVZ9_9MYRT|nr:hypothetical protein SAY87_031960 [Trapa incisa]